jgi:methylenetetrahydrofolate reductase (NADPH)
MGVKRLVALRGDLPSGYGVGGEFSTPAIWWPSSVPRPGATSTSRWRPTEVHPHALAPDLQAFGQGARRRRFGHHPEYFYNADAYARFVDDSASAWASTCPWCPASCPSPARLMRFSDACGARSALDPAAPALRRRRRVDQGLRPRRVPPVRAAAPNAGAPALHFYTMNQSVSTLALLDRPGCPGALSPMAARRVGTGGGCCWACWRARAPGRPGRFFGVDLPVSSRLDAADRGRAPGDPAGAP